MEPVYIRHQAEWLLMYPEIGVGGGGEIETFQNRGGDGLCLWLSVTLFSSLRNSRGAKGSLGGCSPPNAALRRFV